MKNKKENDVFNIQVWNARKDLMYFSVNATNLFDAEKLALKTFKEGLQMIISKNGNFVSQYHIS